MSPLGALGEVGSGLSAARRRSDTACGVAEGTELVDGVAKATASLVLDTKNTRVDVGGGERAVVGASVVVIGESVGPDASLEVVELVGGLAVGSVVDNVFFGRGKLVASLLANQSGRGFGSAARLEGSLGPLRAEDGLLPLNGDVGCKCGVASETVLDLVSVVAGLPVCIDE